MLASAAVIIAYAIGGVPIAHLASRWTSGVDLRERGSGNVGASNVWQSASRWLVVPVGLAQIGQGLAAVLVPLALDQGDGVRVACGIAAVVANNWNPWLRFEGGRGIGTTIGVMLGLGTWEVLAVFIVMSVIGIPNGVPVTMAMALVALPFAAAFAGYGREVVAGMAALTAIAFAKRLLANELPDAAGPRDVWRNRLLFDRDVRDRDAWVRRV